MQNLKILLDRLEKDFHQVEYLSSDPLEYVHQYHDPWDQEVIALLAAVLAYGNVKQIRRSIDHAIDRMGFLASSPSEFVWNLGSPSFIQDSERAFEGYVHRFNLGTDLLVLLRLLHKSWTRFGSLGGHFLTFLDAKDLHFGKALSALIGDWNHTARRWSARSGFFYLLTSPASGSCCKRWCMLLRWMGRKDQLDLGLWTHFSPLAKTFPIGRGLRTDQLIMPLDTHTGRISQYLSLTSRKTLDWKAAEEVTLALKEIDPIDPIRYDFALARLGILTKGQSHRTHRIEKLIQYACTQKTANRTPDRN